MLQQDRQAGTVVVDRQARVVAKIKRCVAELIFEPGGKLGCVGLVATFPAVLVESQPVHEQTEALAAPREGGKQGFAAERHLATVYVDAHGDGQYVVGAGKVVAKGRVEGAADAADGSVGRTLVIAGWQIAFDHRSSTEDAGTAVVDGRIDAAGNRVVHRLGQRSGAGNDRYASQNIERLAGDCLMHLLYARGSFLHDHASDVAVAGFRLRGFRWCSVVRYLCFVATFFHGVLTSEAIPAAPAFRLSKCRRARRACCAAVRRAASP